MSFIFSVIAPIFSLMLIGYLAVRFKFFPIEGVFGLTRFVNSIAAPVLLFRAMLNMKFNEVFRLEYVAPYYIAALVIFALGIFIARVGFKHRPGEAVAMGFSACFVNGLLIGLPLIQRAYGDEGMVLMLTVIGIHAPILYTVGMVTMEMSRQDGAPLSQTLKVAGMNVLKQPLVIGILSGLLGNFIGFEMPEIMADTSKMLALAVLPCALFGIGGALNQYKLSAVWFLASLLSAMKLMLQPLIVWVILILVLGAPMEIAKIFILLAAMPTGINAYIFSTYYNRGVNVATNVILISTVAGFFSISFWLWFLV